MKIKPKNVYLSLRAKRSNLQDRHVPPLAGLAMTVFLVLMLFPVPGYAAKIPERSYPTVDQPKQEFFVGEKLVYSIRYLGIPIGRAEGWIKEVVEIRGRKAYHIVVKIASTTVVDLIYKVRGEHHTYIDVEKLYSLRYQVQSSKNPSQTAFEMNFDHPKNVVDYFYARRKIHKIFPIFKDSQDRLSLGYFFRTLAVKPHEVVSIPVSTEQKNWKIQIKTQGTRKMIFSGVGTFEAIQILPKLDFVSTLKGEGSVRAWISLDERRIPLQLEARAPLIGSIKVSLIAYTPGEPRRK